jgi:hypothetical protein
MAIGKLYENLQDESIYTRSQYAFNKDDFPGISHVGRDVPVYDFSINYDQGLGFKDMRRHVLDELLSGKLDPSKIGNRTPANIVQDMIKEKQIADRKLKKSVEDYTNWQKDNHAKLDTDVRFLDNEGNPTNKKW